MKQKSIKSVLVNPPPFVPVHLHRAFKETLITDNLNGTMKGPSLFVHVHKTVGLLLLFYVSCFILSLSSNPRVRWWPRPLKFFSKNKNMGSVPMLFVHVHPTVTRSKPSVQTHPGPFGYQNASEIWERDTNQTFAHSFRTGFDFAVGFKDSLRSFRSVSRLSVRGHGQL